MQVEPFMKRDMELLRAILFYFEKRESDELITPQDIIAGKAVIVDGYDGRLVSDHVDVMYEGGLLEGYADRAKDGRLIQVYPTRLTWQGHEFLAAARNENVWNKARETLSANSLSLPFKMLQSLLTKYIAHEVGL